MIDVKKLREEFSNLGKEIEDVVTLSGTENRAITPEEKTANDTRFARMNEIKTVLDTEKQLAELKFARGEVQTEQQPDGRAEHDADIRVIDRAQKFDASKIDRQEFNRAIQNWMNSGTMAQKFATITTATQSSLFLPVAVLPPANNQAINTFREAFSVWGLQPEQTIGDSSQFNLPFLDSTTGGLVAENATSETDGTPAVSESIVSKPATYQSGSVYYSNLTLAAQPYDLLGATIPTLQYSKELGLEAAIATAMVGDSNVTQVAATDTIAGFTWKNLVSLNNALPKRYQNRKVMVLSQAAYAAAEGLTDDYGRPVMIADTQNQNLKRIGGTPVIRCDSGFQNFAANHIIGAVFSLMGFHFRDAGEGVQRYTQVPAKPNQTGLNLFGYHAYGWAPSAVAKLKCPAS